MGPRRSKKLFILFKYLDEIFILCLSVCEEFITYYAAERINQIKKLITMKAS